MEIQVGVKKKPNKSTDVFVFQLVIVAHYSHVAVLLQTSDVFNRKILFHQKAIFDETLNAQKCFNLYNHFVENLQNPIHLNLELKLPGRFFAINFIVIWNEYYAILVACYHVWAKFSRSQWCTSTKSGKNAIFS